MGISPFFDFKSLAGAASTASILKINPAQRRAFCRLGGNHQQAFMRQEFPSPISSALAQWTIAARSARRPLSGPSDKSTAAVSNRGTAAHICAAAGGGPRYDRTMTSEARRSMDNAIWVCADLGRVIDNDIVTYTAEILHQDKREHESGASDVMTGLPREPCDECPTSAG